MTSVPREKVIGSCRPFYRDLPIPRLRWNRSACVPYIACVDLNLDCTGSRITHSWSELYSRWWSFVHRLRSIAQRLLVGHVILSTSGFMSEAVMRESGSRQTSLATALSRVGTKCSALGGPETTGVGCNAALNKCKRQVWHSNLMWVHGVPWRGSPCAKVKSGQRLSHAVPRWTIHSSVRTTRALTLLEAHVGSDDLDVGAADQKIGLRDDRVRLWRRN